MCPRHAAPPEELEYAHEAEALSSISKNNLDWKLQDLNSEKEIAANAMCTFLAINTSSVQLILPATVVALMGAAANQIFITTILATGLSTIAAIIAVRFLEKLKRFEVPNGNGHDR